MMTVDGLKPGTTYVFRVRARTDGGYGSYGGEIELETSHEGKEVKNKHLFTRDLSFSLFFFLFIILCNWIAGFIFPPPRLRGIKLKIGTAGIGCTENSDVLVL